MAKKAIRTTLPDGNIAISNIIDKYTGESIQLVKINSLPVGVSVDDIIYFETNTASHGVEYWIREEFNRTGEVNVKWFGAKGDGDITTEVGTDNRLSLQRALNQAEGQTLIIPPGVYLVEVSTNPLRVRSNTTIVMEKGAIIKVISNSEAGYQIFNLTQVNNIKIQGGELIGDKHTHLGTDGQWGYGISVSNCSDVYIDGVTAREFWGDGIYVGSALGESVNISIINCTCDDNRRQGLSLVWSKNVLIDNCRFTNTSGHAPQAGIDIEPNNNTFNRDVIITNTICEGNAGSGIDITCPTDNNNKINEFITINNVRCSNNSIGLRVLTTLSTFSHIRDININGLVCDNNTLQNIYSRYGIRIYIKNYVGREVLGAEDIIIYRTRDFIIENSDINSPTRGIYLDSIQYSPTIKNSSITSDSSCISDSTADVKGSLFILNNIFSSTTQRALDINNVQGGAICNNKVLRSGLENFRLRNVVSTQVSGNLLMNCNLQDTETLPYVSILLTSRFNVVTNNSLFSSTPITNNRVGIELGSNVRGSIVRDNTFNTTDGQPFSTLISDATGGLNNVAATDTTSTSTTANRPNLSRIKRGFMYFDTTLGQPVWWDGSNWVDAAGTTI